MLVKTAAAAIPKSFVYSSAPIAGRAALASRPATAAVTTIDLTHPFIVPLLPSLLRPYHAARRQHAQEMLKRPLHVAGILRLERHLHHVFRMIDLRIRP